MTSTLTALDARDVQKQLSQKLTDGKGDTLTITTDNNNVWVLGIPVGNDGDAIYAALREIAGDRPFHAFRPVGDLSHRVSKGSAGAFLLCN